MTGLRLAVALCLVVTACVAAPSSGVADEPDPSTSTTEQTTTTLVATTTTSPPIHVMGRVISETGGPLSRALVSMGEVTVTTGEDGSFTVETTTPQSAITVAKPGWVEVELDWDESTTFYDITLATQRARGLRVSAEAAGDDQSFAHLIELADETAVNALAFDTKREGGEVLYETDVAVAVEMGAVGTLYDPRSRVEEAHRHGLYTITRIVTFEDSYRAGAFPEEKLAGAWLDPASPSAREYNLALAEEACSLGFDEVMFDYVRYPAGRTAEVAGSLEMPEDERVAAIAGFLAEARRLLNPMGCAVSAAVFAIVVSSPDDQGLGQRPEEVSAQVDVLSPMVYPSHYSNGWLGFDDPNDHPYDVTANAISDALGRMQPGTRLRPWLQAFWWTNEQIRTSIQAAEDLGQGWILWNVRSNFDLEALPGDDEVEP